MKWRAKVNLLKSVSVLQKGKHLENEMESHSERECGRVYWFLRRFEMEWTKLYKRGLEFASLSLLPLLIALGSQ